MTDVQRQSRDDDVQYYLTAEVAATDCSKKERSNECLDEVISGPT